MKACHKERRSFRSTVVSGSQLLSRQRENFYPSAAEANEIVDLSLRLYRDLHTDETTFFAIGRSPTAIAGCLAQLPLVAVQQVPGSLGLCRDAIPSGACFFLEQALHRLRPGTRHLVLIDYCLTGLTLTWFLRQALSWESKWKRGLTIEAAALVHDIKQAEHLRQKDLIESIHSYSLAPYPALRAGLFREDYDRLALATPSFYESYCQHLRGFMGDALQSYPYS